MSAEEAEDFAQDAYIRHLEAGREITLGFAYVDHMRATRGRRLNRTMENLNGKEDFEGMPQWEIGPSIERILEEASSYKMSRHAAMKRLARYFGVTLKVMKEILAEIRAI